MTDAPSQVPKPRRSFRGVLAVVAVVILLGLVLTSGRSCSKARHEIPDTATGEVIWIATFNGL